MSLQVASFRRKEGSCKGRWGTGGSCWQGGALDSELLHWGSEAVLGGQTRAPEPGCSSDPTLAFAVGHAPLFGHHSAHRECRGPAQSEEILRGLRPGELKLLHWGDGEGGSTVLSVQWPDGLWAHPSHCSTPSATRHPGAGRASGFGPLCPTSCPLCSRWTLALPSSSHPFLDAHQLSLPMRRLLTFFCSPKLMLLELLCL